MPQATGASAQAVPGLLYHVVKVRAEVSAKVRARCPGSLDGRGSGAGCPTSVQTQCLGLPSDGPGTSAGSMTWDAPKLSMGGLDRPPLSMVISFGWVWQPFQDRCPSLVTGLTVTLHVQWGHVLPGREVGVQGLLLQPVRGLSLLKPELGTDGGWASEKESTRPTMAHACVQIGTPPHPPTYTPHRSSDCSHRDQSRR